MGGSSWNDAKDPNAIARPRYARKRAVEEVACTLSMEHQQPNTTELVDAVTALPLALHHKVQVRATPPPTLDM